MEAEGVTKYREEFHKSPPINTSDIKELNAWRKILFVKGLIELAKRLANSPLKLKHGAPFAVFYVGF